MTPPDNNDLRARCHALEIELNEAKQALRYYKNIAALTGRKRLKEVEQFNSLIQLHKKAENELKKARDELDLRVKKRTQDLIAVNEKLKNEIGERKKAEHHLKRRTRLLERITDNMFDMVSLSDLEGNYTFAGQSHERILGYTNSELMGRNVMEFVHPDDLPGVVKEFESLLENGGLKKAEFRYRHSKGHYLNFETAAEILSDENQVPNEIIFSTRDITDQIKSNKEKEKLEKELAHAQKMESIGILAGGIAHEFNNIMSIIMGNNELLIDDLPPSSPARESANEIDMACHRARDIVKHLLTFSRQDDALKENIDMPSVVKKSLKLIRATIPANIDIREKITSDSLPVHGDLTQINQVIINICNNAKDSLPISGGRIEIELSKETVDPHMASSVNTLSPGNHARLRISDNGSGMEKGTLDRIFEPFFTTKGVGQGSGIGLAVVHGIVQNHGGSITCESSLGQGTAFTILIPLDEGPIREESIDMKTDVFYGKGEKILYVDDEPSIASMGKRYLESLGYDALSTTDPHEAIEMVKAEPERFGLVISDMAMPQMPGDLLITEILSINPEMPAIICTGYSPRMSEAKASEMGVNAFLMKPFGRSELAKTVRQVLDGSR